MSFLRYSRILGSTAILSLVAGGTVVFAFDGGAPSEGAVSPPLLRAPGPIDQSSAAHTAQPVAPKSNPAPATGTYTARKIVEPIPTYQDKSAGERTIGFDRMYGYPNYNPNASRYYGFGSPYYGYTPFSNLGFRPLDTPYAGFYQYYYYPTSAAYPRYTRRYYRPWYTYPPARNAYRNYYRPWYTYSPGAYGYHYNYAYRYPRFYYPRPGFYYLDDDQPRSFSFFYGY